jgi:hypothetical protein
VGHVKLEAFTVTESNKRLLDVQQCQITTDIPCLGRLYNLQAGERASLLQMTEDICNKSEASTFRHDF